MQEGSSKCKIDILFLGFFSSDNWIFPAFLLNRTLSATRSLLICCLNNGYHPRPTPLLSHTSAMGKVPQKWSFRPRLLLVRCQDVLCRRPGHWQNRRVMTELMPPTPTATPASCWSFLAATVLGPILVDRWPITSTVSTTVTAIIECTIRDPRWTWLTADRQYHCRCSRSFRPAGRRHRCHRDRLGSFAMPPSNDPVYWSALLIAGTFSSLHRRRRTPFQLDSGQLRPWMPSPSPPTHLLLAAPPLPTLFAVRHVAVAKFSSGAFLEFGRARADHSNMDLNTCHGLADPANRLFDPVQVTWSIFTLFELFKGHFSIPVCYCIY